MAKELLVNTLVNILGDYVEGFTKENIKVGILSGNIALKGLGVNRDGIRRRLNLPLQIVHGHVESLEVHVPWKNLDKEHVQIYINGVYVLMNPLGVCEHTKADARQRMFLLRKYKLFQAEKSIKIAAQLTSTSSSREIKQASYFQNLIAKVVDNLDIQLSGVHIRFEDSVKCISFGISLESFSIITTDSDWNEAFVAVDADEDSQQLSRYKLATLRNLGVYWNGVSPLSSHIGFSEWMEFMKSSGGPSSPMHYVLQPSNELIVKLSHQTPNLSVHMESVNLNFHLDKVQYHQISATSAAISSFHKLQRFIQYRPDLPPLQDPRSWWKYAILLVSEKEYILERKVS